MYTEPAKPFLATPTKPFLATPGREPKTATQDQAEARLFGTRMQEANNGIERLEASGKFGTEGGFFESLAKVDPKVLAAVGGAIGAGVGALGRTPTTIAGGAAAGAGIGGSYGAYTSAVVKEYANKFRTPEQSTVCSDKLRFILAVLRDESGSAIGTDEFKMPRRGLLSSVW